MGPREEDLGDVMVPTLNGRIQTRVFVLLVVGGIWTLLITPLLPVPGSLESAYLTTFIILLAVMVLGVGWEFVYHLIQQFRWEKDWPTFFGLITGINEGTLVWLLLGLGLVPGIEGKISFGAYLLQFLTTWILVWLMTNGPMRAPFVHWRFRGGRLI
jgi:hypothetical protein